MGCDTLPDPRLVVKSGDTLLGWAALSPVSGRWCYSGVAEVSLYVGAAQRRQGVGSLLLAALIDASETAGIWTLQGGIFPEESASLALVRKHGFREAGRRERLGKMTYGSFGCMGVTSFSWNGAARWLGSNRGRHTKLDAGADLLVKAMPIHQFMGVLERTGCNRRRPWGILSLPALLRQ